MLSILVLSTKKRYSIFLKSACIFQKIHFKVKVLKSFKIFSDCHIKVCRSLKWRAILKIPSTFFRRTYALSVGFKMKPLRKSVFLCEDKDQLSCWNPKRSNHLFISNWWIAFFKHLYSLILWPYIEINWLCKQRKKVRSCQTCISIYSCTKLSKTKFSLWLLLSQSKCSLEPKNFLKGSTP